MDFGIPQGEATIDATALTGTNLELLPVFLFWAIFITLFLIVAKKIIKALAYRSSYYSHAVYLVRLPKEKPKDNERELTVQQLREEIARGETLFASIGGLRAQRGPRSWLLGRHDHYSFEIVANKKKISFYLVAPRYAGRYLEQQVQAHYPEAVMEEVRDYNIFLPQTAVLAGFLKTRRNPILPLKTYNKMEVDPLNSIINTLSKLDEGEGIAVQYVVRSAKGSWHAKAAHVVSRVYQGKKLSEAIETGFFNKLFSLLGGAAKSIPAGDKNKGQIDPYNARRMTTAEEQIVKGIEEKNAKSGLDVNLRVIVSAVDSGKAKLLLNNLIGAYSQYNLYEFGNSFINRLTLGYRLINHFSGYWQERLIKDFIHRRFNEYIGFLLNSEELTGLFHLPLRWTETPNIAWLTSRQSAAPADTPESGINLGHNYFRGVSKDIRLKREDRRRHTYIIGKSGTGKSQLMAGMAIQDILNGEGVCVLDPHGDLINDILKRVPPERAEDVIIFSPADIERPLALNLLEYDERYPEQKTFVINEMIKIFDKLYDLKATGGPIFEQYMRNAMLLIMSHPESGSTLMEIPKVLSDPSFRKMKLDHCGDPTVVDFWRKEAEKAGGDAALANVVPYVTSKLTQFISNDTMRPIIGQQKSSFNLRDVMDKRKILLVDLTKGLVGEMNAHLLGMILVGKILMSALSRADMDASIRKDFYLYIDEFQNFTTDSISSILSEARKYGLNLIIAHQYLGQLVTHGNNTQIKDAVFGNVGTWIVFKIGSEDAAVMEKEFAPVFNQYDLINIEKYTAYIKLLIDNTASRPFSLHTLWPLPGVEHDDFINRIRSLSRLKFGQDRELIEAEILRRGRAWEEG